MYECLSCHNKLDLYVSCHDDIYCDKCSTVLCIHCLKRCYKPLECYDCKQKSSMLLVRCQNNSNSKKQCKRYYCVLSCGTDRLCNYCDFNQRKMLLLYFSIIMTLTFQTSIILLGTFFMNLLNNLVLKDWFFKLTLPVIVSTPIIYVIIGFILAILIFPEKFRCWKKT